MFCGSVLQILGRFEEETKKFSVWNPNSPVNSPTLTALSEFGCFTKLYRALMALCNFKKKEYFAI